MPTLASVSSEGMASIGRGAFVGLTAHSLIRLKGRSASMVLTTTIRSTLILDTVVRCGLVKLVNVATVNRGFFYARPLVKQL
jgi:hypothetical protein